MRYYDGDFATICQELWWHLMEEGDEVNTVHWQSLEGTPHANTRELFRVCIETPILQSITAAQIYIEPNTPWAEDHFQERVAGRPLNPGNQYMNWPYYRGGVEDHKQTGQFSHTYMERFWPRQAGYRDPEGTNYDNHGIRYRLGDLQDVINLLARAPTTRQAYLPVWSMEDTGAHHGERVPCTLGYHFMLRGGLLHVTYHIRSCDFLRYFRDDVYMAMRLGQWMLGSLQPDLEIEEPGYNQWYGVQMGILQMNIVSLHVFDGDLPKMRREAPAKP